MSSETGSSKKEQRETVTELTDEFYKEEEVPDSTVTGHTALQSDSQAIYVSIVKADNHFCYPLALPKISYLGEDVEEIPASLCRNHGSTAKRLDLSYNRLRCVIAYTAARISNIIDSFCEYLLWYCKISGVQKF